MSATPDQYILETARLHLRLLTVEDAAFMLELLNSPGWLKYIGDRGVHTQEQAGDYIKNGALKSYDENGYGPYLVCRKEDQLPLGVCGLFKRPSLEHPDIGFAFLPTFMGQGYAFEAASAVATFALTVLRIEQLFAITIPENHHSIRLLEKIGLNFQKLIHLPNDEEEIMLFTSNPKNREDG